MACCWPGRNAGFVKQLCKVPFLHVDLPDFIVRGITWACCLYENICVALVSLWGVCVC